MQISICADGRHQSCRPRTHVLARVDDKIAHCDIAYATHTQRRASTPHALHRHESFQSHHPNFARGLTVAWCCPATWTRRSSYRPFSELRPRTAWRRLALSVKAEQFQRGNNAMTAGSNLAPHIAYDDLREWLAHRRAARRGQAPCKGATWQEDIGLVAEAILRAENGPCVVFDDVPGCPKGFRLLLNMFAGTAPQHDVRLSRSPDQVGAQRRLSRGLSEGPEDHPARDRRETARCSRTS